MEKIEQQLVIDLKPILNNKGYDIESINYWKAKSQYKKGKLQIIIANIDKSPITVEDCSVVSKEVAIVIDVNNSIEEAYTLEVSSKGCEDILIFFNDFVKNIGKMVCVELHSKRDEIFIAKIIKAVAGRISFIKVEDSINNKIIVSINDIKSAKLTETQGATETL